MPLVRQGKPTDGEGTGYMRRLCGHKLDQRWAEPLGARSNFRAGDYIQCLVGRGMGNRRCGRTSIAGLLRTNGDWASGGVRWPPSLSNECRSHSGQGGSREHRSFLRIGLRTSYMGNTRNGPFVVAGELARNWLLRTGNPHDLG